MGSGYHRSHWEQRSHRSNWVQGQGPKGEAGRTGATGSQRIGFSDLVSTVFDSFLFFQLFFYIWVRLYLSIAYCIFMLNYTPYFRCYWSNWCTGSCWLFRHPWCSYTCWRHWCSWISWYCWTYRTLAPWDLLGVEELVLQDHLVLWAPWTFWSAWSYWFD